MGTIGVTTAVVPSGNTGASTFGADTRSGAGADQPLGALTNAANTGIGTATGVSVSTAGVLSPSSNGSLSGQDGKTVVISSDQGYYTVTLSVTADEYSVASEAELEAALSACNGAGGKTIRARAAGWSLHGNNLGDGYTYSSPVTFTGESGTVIVGETIFSNVANIVVEGLTFYRTGASSGACLTFINGCQSFTIQDCTFHGTYYDPLGSTASFASYANCDGINGSLGGTSIIRRNLFYDLSEGITLGVSGGMTITDNEIYHLYSDCMKLTVSGSGLTAVKDISRNVMYNMIGRPGDASNPHTDLIQMLSSAGNDGLSMTNLTVRQNVAWCNASEARGQGIQGFCAFTDGGYNVIIDGAVVEGNSFHINSGHAIALFAVAGGTYRNNTITATGEGTNTLTQRIWLGDVSSSGTITVTDNVSDSYSLQGAATYTTSNNTTLGDEGATIPYTTAFDGSSFPVSGFANVKTAWSVASGTAGAIGSGRGTYGDVRDATGWSWT